MVICFLSIIGIALVGESDGTYNHYMIGISLAIGVSWILALTTVLVRHMREIHFSVVLF